MFAGAFSLSSLSHIFDFSNESADVTSKTTRAAIAFLKYIKGLLVIHLSEGFESLLACRVPNLKFNDVRV